MIKTVGKAAPEKLCKPLGSTSEYQDTGDLVRQEHNGKA